jgi:peptidyl-prolyl cis-trans isomerase SurA
MTQAFRLITLLFLLLPMLTVQAKVTPLDSIVAVVNDDVILKSELDEAMKQAIDTLKSRNVAMPPQEILQQQVLESLVVKRLQLVMAQRMNLTVDDQRLNQALEAFARRNGMNSLSALKKSLEKQGKDYNRFREDVREEITLSDLHQRMVGPLVNVSEQEIDNFLANLQAQGQMEVEYHLAHILIATPQAASSEQIAAIQKKAEGVLASLRSGADFARTAVEKSQGSNALTGGDMGWIKAQQLPSLFSNVVPSMHPGEISDLIRSTSGFHIIKLVDVRTNTARSHGTDIKQMQEQARQAIYQRKFQEQMEQWLRQLREEAYVEIRL